MSKNLDEINKDFRDALALAEMYAMRNDGEIVDELIEIIEKSDIARKDKFDGYMKIINTKQEESAKWKTKAKRMGVMSKKLDSEVNELLNNLGRVMGKESYESEYGKITGHLDVSTQVFTTPAKTPDEYTKMVEQKPKRTIDTAKIKEDLEAGKELTFARLLSKKRVVL